jgi:hypothetical protein
MALGGTLSISASDLILEFFICFLSSTERAAGQLYVIAY